MLPKQGIIYFNSKSNSGIVMPSDISPPLSERIQKQKAQKLSSHNDLQSVDEAPTGVQLAEEASQKSLKEGHNDFRKDGVKNRDQFNALHTSSDKILLECSAVFPFQLFPDKIIIDLHKVNLIYKYLPWSHTTQSIYIDDVAEVDISTGLFFATIKITDKFFTHVDNKITFLKKSDASRARRIIQGLIVIIREKIDIDRLSDEQLVAKIEDIGSVVGPNHVTTRS